MAEQENVVVVMEPVQYLEAFYLPTLALDVMELLSVLLAKDLAL